MNRARGSLRRMGQTGPRAAGEPRETTAVRMFTPKSIAAPPYGRRAALRALVGGLAVLATAPTALAGQVPNFQIPFDPPPPNTPPPNTPPAPPPSARIPRPEVRAQAPGFLRPHVPPRLPGPGVSQ